MQNYTESAAKTSKKDAETSENSQKHAQKLAKHAIYAKSMQTNQYM